MTSGLESVYPRKNKPREDVVLIVVDLCHPRDGWREAHEGRVRPDQQYLRAYDLDGGNHWLLVFPDNATEVPA